MGDRNYPAETQTQTQTSPGFQIVDLVRLENLVKHSAKLKFNVNDFAFKQLKTLFFFTCSSRFIVIQGPSNRFNVKFEKDPRLSTLLYATDTVDENTSERCCSQININLTTYFFFYQNNMFTVFSFFLSRRRLHK